MWTVALIVLLVSNVQVQQYLHVKQNVPTATTQIGAPTASIDYYSMPFTADRIIFVDSMPSYERLHDRLFRNESEDILIGFDCEWKPVFNNTSTSKQRISVMQIAFDDQVFLLDLLNFFHTCDSQTVQQRLATRLFDDDRVTLISTSLPCKTILSHSHAFRLRLSFGCGDAHCFVSDVRSSSAIWKDSPRSLPRAERRTYIASSLLCSHSAIPVRS